MNTTKNWYAIYTKPRWEKKVHQLLNDQGFTSYCPLNKVRKKWSDRFKIVEEPLFKSYVFVKLGEADKTNVRMINGVVNFVYWLGKPAIIQEKEIQTIRKFLNEYENVRVEAMEPMPRQKVKITTGVFMEKEGEVLKVVNNKVVIQINSLGYRLVADLHKGNFEIIHPQNGGRKDAPKK